MTVQPPPPSRPAASSSFPALASKIAIGTLDICGAGARALLSLSPDDTPSKLEKTAHAVELRSLATASSRCAFPASEPSTSSLTVVVINFSNPGSSTPSASLIVFRAPVGDADAAPVAAELARGVAESVGDSPSSSVLLLAALRLPGNAPKNSGRVFWGGNHEGLSKSSTSSSETLPLDARISDGFVAALALSLSLSLDQKKSTVALAAVDGRRHPAVVPFSSSSRKKGEGAAAPATSTEEEEDSEALDAASALGEAAAEAFLGLKFSRAKAARLVPLRAALLEGAAASSSAVSVSTKGNAPAPLLPLLQGAEQMYG